MKMTDKELLKFISKTFDNKLIKDLDPWEREVARHLVANGYLITKKDQGVGWTSRDSWQDSLNEPYVPSFSLHLP